MKFQTINPATGNLIKEYSYLPFNEAEALVGSLYSSFQEWSQIPLQGRIQFLNRVADQIRANKAELTRLMNLEMGKVQPEAEAEVDKSLTVFPYYFSIAEGLLGSRQIVSNYDESYVLKEPMGVVLTIMPWNFPVWQVLRFAVPALLAGNSVLLKHSEITAGVALLLEECFQRAANFEFEKNVFRNAFLTHPDVASLIANPFIRGVTFTGSERGGRQVAAVAGQNLKKCVLELGGMDAYIVLADADLEQSAEALVRGRFVNCGQSCVAAKRWLVHESVALKFKEIVLDKISKLKLAPLAHRKFQVCIHEQVQDLVQAGGKLLIGGELPVGDSAFYPPTLIEFQDLLKHTKEQWKSLVDEEVFGPVALMFQFSHESEAVHFANASVYGLGGGVFSRDLNKAKELALKLEAGFVVINDFVKSEAGIPFGGVKNSGYGRELGPEGLQEFLATRSVGVRYLKL